MNMAHIQNVVISVFLVLNLYSITPTNLIYAIRNPQNQEQEFVQSTVEPPKYEPKKKKMIHFFACPGSKDQRVGDYRNEFKLERVIGHEKSEDGSKCITLYEN